MIKSYASIILLLITYSTIAQSNPNPMEIPLEKYGNRNLKKVKVVVEKDTLDFLFDTGGGVTTVSPELVTKLNLKQGGRSHGYRMTGEEISTPVAENFPIQIGSYKTKVDASVVDLNKYLGKDAPKVYGMISLHTFQDRAITLDLPNNKLYVESSLSLLNRTKQMKPVDVRIATGLEGSEVTAYIRIPYDSGSYWFEWDSGHQGTTFIAPYVAAALGVKDTTIKTLETTLTLNEQEVFLPLQVKKIIHDGVLNSGTLHRAVWSIDLKNRKMWVSSFKPLLNYKDDGNKVEITKDPSGVYKVISIVNGKPEPALVRVKKEGTEYKVIKRFIGDENEIELKNFAFANNIMEYDLPMNRTYKVKITFNGKDGKGTWGDEKMGGEIEAYKLIEY